jgi:glycerophosphoryl diester phosphodiesterase
MNEGYLNPMPRVVAHRGDSKHFPENTMPAFLSAVKMGIDIVETDVHITRDGVVVIWHDNTLERNTDGHGTVEEHSYDELLKYDAAYTFSKDNGKTFPFRDTGVKICKLEDVLQSCPNQRFNIDLKTKQNGIVEEFIRIVRKCGAENRVCCASFHLSNLKSIRRIAPDILTSITTVEVVNLLLRQKLRILPKKIGHGRKIIFQVPEGGYGLKVTTPSFVRMMHERGAVIMVWTINEESDMRRLFKLGVDAIMTDDPSTVIKVAEDMGLR